MDLNAEWEDCRACPWCGSKKSELFGRELRGFQAVTCGDCDVIYLTRRLSARGQELFYANYLSEQHESDAGMVADRAEMYGLESALIIPFVHRNGRPARVLDVGCSRGLFLDRFQAAGFECFGVELGKEAATAAGENHRIWQGELPALSIDVTFDLVSFRGVIEHCINPKDYLEKAWQLLAPGGVLFITSTPNSEAHCASLFQEMWNQHEPEGHLFHLATAHLDEYFTGLGGEKLLERYLYEETPYANPKHDIEAVARAQTLRDAGQPIPFVSPPFWGNMLSVAYRKTAV